MHGEVLKKNVNSGMPARSVLAARVVTPSPRPDSAPVVAAAKQPADAVAAIHRVNSAISRQSSNEYARIYKTPVARRNNQQLQKSIENKRKQQQNLVRNPSIDKALNVNNNNNNNNIDKMQNYERRSPYLENLYRQRQKEELIFKKQLQEFKDKQKQKYLIRARDVGLRNVLSSQNMNENKVL